MTDKIPFWKAKTLPEMTLDEWESLCDGCGKCCLNKLEDADDGTVHYTNAACKLLDSDSCRCTNYTMRTLLVPDCVELLPTNLPTLQWLPSTCAYRLIYEGKELYPWHPLLSGDPDSTRMAGMSVAGRVVSESDVIDLEDHIVTWPE